jgi:Mg/Co/Ni transporter MgtE
VNIIGFLVGIVLFVGGLVIMGYSLQPIEWLPLPFGLDARSALFFAGIIASSLGLAVPFHIMKRIDG